MTSTPDHARDAAPNQGTDHTPHDRSEATARNAPDRPQRSMHQPAPGRRDPEGRRRAILLAAAEIISELGPAALTHRGVAARASVSLGSTTQYFSSIDELREAALQQLADEIDHSLALMEPFTADLAGNAERLVAEIHRFLRDARAVHSDIALMMTGTTDPRMRTLALRWNDRLIDMLAQHIGRERATAIAIYLDGATMHAGLHEAPLSEAHLSRVLHALLAMPIANGEERPGAAAPASAADPHT